VPSVLIPARRPTRRLLCYISARRPPPRSWAPTWTPSSASCLGLCPPVLNLGFCAQAHATAAVLNFSEEATPEILGPYMDALISKLLVLMQHPRKIVQEGALTAIAGVADCAQVQYSAPCLFLPTQQGG